MRCTQYYLIEPRPQLSLHLKDRCNPEFAELLLEPLLISRETWDDKSGSWGENEHAHAVKLLYLARVREYDPFSENSAARQILGSDRVSAQTFDAWWTIRGVELEGDSGEMESYLSSLGPLVDKTGNSAIDSWLEKVLSR